MVNKSVEIERKNYIDNLRILCILLLFPYHTGMIYNGFLKTYYVHYGYVESIDNFLMIINWWYMPMMFVLAGISAYFALRKRSVWQFLKERFVKLLVPCFFTVILVLPSISYIAEVFHNGFSGDFLSQYLTYFTKYNTVYGFTGGFTPSHIWFIMNLWGIIATSFPVLALFVKYREKIKVHKMPLFVIYLLFLYPLISTPMVIVGIYSLGQNLAVFILGFLVLSDEDILKKLNKNKWICSIIAVLSLIVILIIYNKIGYKDFLRSKTIIVYVIENFTMWSCILALIALSQSYLNMSNKITKYFSKVSFQIYLFHHTFILAVAFFILKITSNVPVQFLSIVIISFALTLIPCEIVRRNSVLSFMFGAKYVKKGP